jgi:hypothetical protein
MINNVDISNNYLTEINIGPKMCKIKSLDLSNNKLKIINCNLDGIKMHDLFLHKNNLESLILNNVSIERLKLNNNKLTKFSFTGVINFLDCANNKLTEINIENIKKLNCSYNNLTCIKNVNILTSLNCSHNKNLEDTLVIDGNNIVNLNIVNTNIKYILTKNQTKKLKKFRFNKDKLITNVSKNKNKIFIETMDKSATIERNREKKLLRLNKENNKEPKIKNIFTDCLDVENCLLSLFDTNTVDI